MLLVVLIMYIKLVLDKVQQLTINGVLQLLLLT